MNILHVNTHDVAGGAAKVAWRLAAWQRAAGHSALLLVGCKLAQTPHSIAFEIGADAALRDRCVQAGELFYELQGSHLVGPAVVTQDLVHLHNLHGGYFNPFSLPLVANLRPTVWTLHDMQALTGHCAHSFECERWQVGCGLCSRLDIEPSLVQDRSAALWSEKRETYRLSPMHVVVPSRWLMAKVQRSSLADHPLHHVPNGLDTNVFAPRAKQEARALLGLPQNSVLVGSVAQGGVAQNQWKGWQYTDAALRTLTERHSDLHYVSIGGDTEPGPRRHALGRIDDEAKLALAYSALDLFLYTPVADNCPLVVQEALACGVPVVTFDTGGTAELCRDGVDGLVVPFGDVSALVQAASHLVGDAEHRQEYASQARSGAVQRFDRAVIDDAYQRVYAAACRDFEQRSPIQPADLWAVAPDVVRTPAFQQGLQFLADHATTPAISTQADFATLR